MPISAPSLWRRRRSRQGALRASLFHLLDEVAQRGREVDVVLGRLALERTQGLRQTGQSVGAPLAHRVEMRAFGGPAPTSHYAVEERTAAGHFLFLRGDEIAFVVPVRAEAVNLLATGDR